MILNFFANKCLQLFIYPSNFSLQLCFTRPGNSGLERMDCLRNAERSSPMKAFKRNANRG